MPSGSSVTQISQSGSARPQNRPRKNPRSSRRMIAATNRSADQWCTCRISSPPRTSKLMASTDWYAWLMVWADETTVALAREESPPWESLVAPLGTGAAA